MCFVLQIPFAMINFIELRCREFIHAYRSTSKRDILWFTTELVESWNDFIAWSYELLERGRNIRLLQWFQINDIFERLDHIAQTIKSYCPQYFIDGETNLWILKPSNKCSGAGIQLERNFENIREFLKKPNVIRQNYIIQKYIERPLQIFKVKVDLRQYFLITNTRPIKIWMYREGYVKFCSLPFSVNDLRDGVHLSNVKVQSRYRMFRASGVPEECMWDFAQFKQYLASIGKGNEWDASIYPSMCETITVVVLDHLKRNLGKMHSLSSFQLLGADFALTENLEPWLIEINSNPGLSPNTYVINNVVTTLLKDIIKVTVDFPLDSTTDTGLFERICTNTSVKHGNFTKTDTKEYYYHQPLKSTIKHGHKLLKK
uniref:Tubulin glycylase 3A n=1 Tax=Sipha flava TaxID=143950 RepID=A0A2S2Q2G5_9HEMI